MIRININYHDNYINKITLKGHANYEDYGKDIVCAAVSATYLCTANAILSINNKSIEVLTDNDKQTIIVKEYNDITNKLLINMINCLKSLEKEYPNNIKLN